MTIIIGLLFITNALTLYLLLLEHGWRKDFEEECEMLEKQLKDYQVKHIDEMIIKLEGK